MYFILLHIQQPEGRRHIRASNKKQQSFFTGIQKDATIRANRSELIAKQGRTETYMKTRSGQRGRPSAQFKTKVLHKDLLSQFASQPRCSTPCPISPLCHQTGLMVVRFVHPLKQQRLHLINQHVTTPKCRDVTNYVVQQSNQQQSKLKNEMQGQAPSPIYTGIHLQHHTQHEV